MSALNFDFRDSEIMNGSFESAKMSPGLSQELPFPDHVIVYAASIFYFFCCPIGSQFPLASSHSYQRIQKAQEELGFQMEVATAKAEETFASVHQGNMAKNLTQISVIELVSSGE